MIEFLTDRRDWLKRAAALAATGLVIVPSDVAHSAEASGDVLAVRLVADPSKTLFRVRVEMDVEGNVNVPRNALVSKETSSQYPLRGKSVLDWEERVLGFDEDRTAATAERHYHEASGEGTSGKLSKKVSLKTLSRYLLVRRDESKWVTYSPDNYLSGSELELLELPANSLALDGLLPVAAVRAGDSYKPSKEVLAKLLSLAAVDDSDVVAEIHSLESDSAKIHLKGKIQGSVAGVPTTIDLVGKMVFDRQVLTTNWLAMAIREQREIGKSEPGFDVAATIKMIRKPLEVPTRLSSIPSASPETSIPKDRLYCELTSSTVGFATLMDRRWKMMSDVAGASMMRMIENDRGIAQCDIRPSGKMAAGAQLTMQALIVDVKQSLGDRFGQLIESREEVNEFGLRVLRVTIHGLVEGVPVQWVFMHFSDDNGRRMLATMTVGGNELETFTGADVQLSSTFRFLPIEQVTPDVQETPDVTTADLKPANKK